MAEAQFSKGDEVEVTVAEDGFRGSWFSATVIRSIPKTKKIHVQYHDLLKEEGKTTKLREYVYAYNVRPPAPRETNRIFKLYDEVDAYHNDAWWEGDITRIVEEEGKEKFVVYFRGSKEETAFEPSQLRIHREWVNGLWVPPMEEQQGTLPNSEADQNKESSKLLISKGKQPITVADQTNESSKPMVNVRKSTRLKSRADKANEPSKSREDQAFEPSKLVPKFSKKTVSKSGTDQKESTEAMVNLSKGTPSMSGADKTIESPKHGIKLTMGMSSMSGSDQNKEASEFVVKFDNGTPVEICSDDIGFNGAWFVGTVVETIGENRFLVEHKNLKTDDLTEFLKEEVDSLHIRPAPPEILKYQFKKLERVDALYMDAWWTGMISQVERNSPQPKCHVYFMNTGEEIQFEHHQLRPHQEWIRGEWVRDSEAL